MSSAKNENDLGGGDSVSASERSEAETSQSGDVGGEGDEGAQGDDINAAASENGAEKLEDLQPEKDGSEPDSDGEGSARRFVIRQYGGSVVLEPSVPVFGSSAKAMEEAPEKGSFAEAVKFAKLQPSTAVYWEDSEVPLWDNVSALPKEAKIEVERLGQLPELPRGCEVTSLAMLLGSRSIEADKLELAERIEKDETPLRVSGGVVSFGDPNKGFVGDIYDLSKNGYGVYHKPVFSLLSQYAPDSALDLTGCDFADALYFVASGTPVWIITNSWYSKLPDSQFETWTTPGGKIKATYREHSVLVTGYDSDRVYFNDPLLSAESARMGPFVEAWIQMGRQAVTLAPASSKEDIPNNSPLKFLES
jgi:uncharacterized protein YvpB